MSRTETVDIPMGRVEGDLSVKAELRDGVVVDSWCAGTMYRGLERVLVGRGALDGLVIAPRVCGICSTSHLVAAARALESASGIEPPPDAVRVRSLALGAEHLTSDLRHVFLLFAPDLARPAYAASPFFPEAKRRWEALAGDSSMRVIRETKRLLEVVAILGGQWPHSSFIVPGGVASLAGPADLLSVATLLAAYRRFFERRVLGGALDRFVELQTSEQLDAWLAGSREAAEGDLGLLLRMGRSLGLHRSGRGHGRFLSFGLLDGHGNGTPPLLPAGLFDGRTRRPLDAALITEHLASSWYEGPEEGQHPLESDTRPYASGHESGRYSWAKAPRYDDLPAETGPLAELLVAGHPLVTELYRKDGPSALLRELARLVRSALLLPHLQRAAEGEVHHLYEKPSSPPEGTGVGLVEAARGALGHFVRFHDGRIASYQIISPTTWNASPRDARGTRGPMEEALIGTVVKDPGDAVELSHVVRSFDPCLVCTVHTVVRDGGRRR